MKSIRNFILSMLSTILIIMIISFVIQKKVEPKQSYNLSTTLAVSNNNGIIINEMSNIDEFINEDGNFELKISIGSNEERKIKYEISLLVDYEQIEFLPKQEKEWVDSYKVSIDNENKDIFIIVDKNVFKKNNTQFMVCVRSDIEVYSYKNTLVRDLESISLRYNIINENYNNNDSNDDMFEMKKVIIDKIMPINDDDGVRCNISLLNREEKSLINIDGNETILIKLEIGGGIASNDYAIWALMNSEQVNINNEKYILTHIDKSMLGVMNLEIEAPKEQGIYELQVFCAPLPFEEINEDNISECRVVSSIRYTVEVR